MDHLEALSHQEQCDEHGIMCIVSRQAVDEAIEEITRLRQQVAELECHAMALREELNKSAEAYNNMCQLVAELETKRGLLKYINGELRQDLVNYRNRIDDLNMASRNAIQEANELRLRVAELESDNETLQVLYKGALTDIANLNRGFEERGERMKLIRQCIGAYNWPIPYDELASWFDPETGEPL